MAANLKLTTLLLYLFADDSHFPKLTTSHLQLIRYGTASNKQNLRLLQRLAPEWRRVGQILGLPSAVIQSIENLGSGRSPEDCVFQVFVRWLENAPQLPSYSQYPLTWRGLYNLLQDSEHGEAASELKVALSSPFNTVQDIYEAAGMFDDCHQSIYNIPSC